MFQLITTIRIFESMKPEKKHITKMQEGIIKAAKDKQRVIDYFKKGGKIKDFKEKDPRVVRPI